MVAVWATEVVSRWVDDSAFSPRATGSRAGINTLVGGTCLGSVTIGVEDTLWSTLEIRVARQSRWTFTCTDSIAGCLVYTRDKGCQTVQMDIYMYRLH